MTTAYMKTAVGNKLFIIEWNLDAVPGPEINGDAFEGIDCELVSIFGIVPTGLEGYLALSNDADPSLYRVSILVADVFLTDQPGTIKLPSSVRWYYPYVYTPSVSATMRVSMLFKEI